MKISELLGGSLHEAATGGTTSSVSVGTGAVYPNKPPKQKTNPDGTAVNALNTNQNLLTGGSITKRA